MKIYGAWIASLAWSAAAIAAPLVEDTTPQFFPVNALAYSNSAEARAVWTPMEGSPPVEVTDLPEPGVLRLPCRFATTEVKRASWDLAIDLDLTDCRGVQFRFFCDDTTPVSQFSLYLHSGEGWYATTFGPTQEEGWCTVTIGSGSTKVEGSPGGFGSIDTIRVSAWRGGDTDTDLYLADLGKWGADAAIAVVRGESCIDTEPDERVGFVRYTANITRFLDEWNVGYTFWGDRDVTAVRLKGKQLVILPYNPSLPAPQAKAMVDFLHGDGNLLAFYTFPPALSKAIGIGRGTHVKAAYPGQFASMRPTNDVVAALPPQTGQNSWNIFRVEALPERSRVAAHWFDQRGRDTGEPALVVSDNGAVMTHVLLDDHPKEKGRFLMAVTAHFAPTVWREAAAAILKRLNDSRILASMRKAAAESYRHSDPDTASADLLRASTTLGLKAGADYLKDRPLRAIEMAQKAEEVLMEAYYRSQPALPGEYRAVWCHRAYGIEGLSWSNSISRLADAGFSAIFPNMAWGGTAFYESDVLPRAEETGDRSQAAGGRDQEAEKQAEEPRITRMARMQRDYLAECLAACKENGIECHVWKVCWNMGRHASPDFVRRMQREGRTQVRFDGTPESRWLCPSHPKNQDLEIEAMLEIVRRYPVEGVHFDYIRYPSSDTCFCNGCRERFQAAVGQTIEPWPGKVRKDPALHEQWLEFRRRNIDQVVESVSRQAREIRPAIKISAAVFAQWPSARDRVAQDWKLWCDRGWLDFVCPMDYTPNAMEFEQDVQRQLQWAGDVPCFPGIGLSTWQMSGKEERLVELIRITRRLKTGGFTLFEYDAAEAEEILPLLSLGMTRN